MENEMSNKEVMEIEKKEIRGLNIRTTILVLAATISIVTTTVLWCSKISAQIDTIKNDSIYEKRYNDLRMSIMEKSLDALKLSIDNLKQQK